MKPAKNSCKVGHRAAGLTGLGRREIELLSSPSTSRARAAEILSSPQVMSEIFRERLSWLFPKGAVLASCRPKVLMKRLGSRQVVSYRLLFSGNEKPLTLVLKRYADKTQGEKTYSAMRILWENGFDRKSRFRIPEPLSYLQDLGLLVLEKAVGRQLSEIFGQGGPVVIARMRTVGRWLAKLHSLDIDLGGISPHPEEETSAKDYVLMAKEKGYRSAEEMESLTVLALSRLSAFKDVQAVPVHGDFQCPNIFAGRDSITVIDFDRFCRSDPARDLGYMIAQTRAMGFWTGVSKRAVYSGLKAFEEAYLAEAPQREGDTLSARASLFAAIKCLQNIFYLLLYMPPGGSMAEEDMERLSVLLDEAEHFCKLEDVEEALKVPVASGH